jgi:hypothetical protein
MIESFLNFFFSLIKKLLFIGILFVLAIWGWNWFKDKREGKSFVVSFNNVDGLSKGAPVMVQGIKVGKVIQIYPLLNSDKIAVKALITHKDFSRPGPEAEALIITNIQGGGGKILELRNLFHSSIGEASMGSTNKGQTPVLIKDTSRLLLDFMQLSKDFAIDFWKMITSQESRDYQAELTSQIENSIASLEYGTVEADLRNEINSLNQKIKEIESDENQDFKTKKALLDQIDVLKNTIKSYGTISDVYAK